MNQELLAFTTAYGVVLLLAVYYVVSEMIRQVKKFNKN